MPDIRQQLRFLTNHHNLVREAVRRRKNFSLDKMRKRHNKWREAEDQFVAYMPEKKADADRRVLRDTGGEPQFTTLKVPFDYAVLMAAHTYWTSVFLGRNPVLQYQARSGQPQSAVLAVEAIIDYQVLVGRMQPPLYIWLLDVGKYGMGILGDFWDEEQIIVNQEVDVPDTFLGVDLGTTTKEMRRVRVEGYQGNRIYNVRPFDFLPDPRVTIQDLQSGEFCGRYTQVGWNTIQKGVAQGKYFNIEPLRAMRNRSASDREASSARVERPFGPEDHAFLSANDMTFVELLEMYIELIPRDWNLGDSEMPEKWVFTLANDEVIIGAQPLGLFNNKYPFFGLEMEPEGYSMFKRSMLDLAKPMTDVMTWLVNTHFYNTRKSLNDMFVVDPTKVVMKDVKDPSPGRIIRLKEEMYGQDIRSAIWQFPVNNVTQQHISDMQVMAQLVQRVTGVNDNIMGLVNAGGRKTATEVRTSSTFGINRLKTVSEWFSATGFTDMSEILLQNTQQFYNGQKQFRLAGDLFNHPGAQNFLEVSPQDITGFFDFVPVDGTLPVDRFAQVNMWTTLLQQMAQAPQVLQEYDVAKIFAWVAQLGGLKNIGQFRIQVEDGNALAAQAQAGNVIPLADRGGRRTTSEPREAGEPPPGLQTPGVGFAG